MCSYSWGIKCGIRDFIGRSEKKIGRGMEIMAARMAAQRRGFLDETEIERCLLFSTFAWPTSSIQYTKIQKMQIDCSHYLFPHQQVLLGSWLVGWWALLRSTSGLWQREEAIPQLGESITYIPIIPTFPLDSNANRFLA